MTKIQNSFRSLNIGIWILFVICYLVIGILLAYGFNVIRENITNLVTCDTRGYSSSCVFNTRCGTPWAINSTGQVSSILQLYIISIISPVSSA